ncbi:hypothetical protein JKP88DRAFT_242595 [Tribonema minus]|uniref:Secreted protein n=1 Tax=Tribonema minus TaxID=303371 RepID=A0A835ZIB8_9STRA|nr:hypothetical protein JKP88DRAFT_242595 [Tribonema minus]
MIMKVLATITYFVLFLVSDTPGASAVAVEDEHRDLQQYYESEYYYGGSGGGGSASYACGWAGCSVSGSTGWSYGRNVDPVTGNTYFVDDTDASNMSRAYYAPRDADDVDKTFQNIYKHTDTQAIQKSDENQALHEQDPHNKEQQVQSNKENTTKGRKGCKR